MAEGKEPLLVDTPYPRFLVTMGKPDDFRPALEVDADEFIPIRSIGTKGKKITGYAVASRAELEPTRQPESAEEPETVDGAAEADEGDVSTSTDSLF